MVKDIYASINVPKPYLSKLLQELARQGIISSTRGPKGGFYLTGENRRQPLIRIIEVIDGPIRLNSCMLSLEGCNEQRPCPLHVIMQPARAQLKRLLEQISVNDLSDDLHKEKSFLPL
jgi:Rrf2 family protein